MDEKLILQKASDFFTLGQIVSAKKAGGDANANYLVDTDKGNFLFKIILEPHPIEDKRAEASYVSLLKDNGLPVSLYHGHGNGDTVFEDEGIKVMVQTAIPNSEYADKGLASVQIIEAMAKTHLIPYGDLPDRASWLKPQSLERHMLMLKEKFSDQEGPRKIIACYESLEHFIHDVLPALPKSIIHGDLHLGNALFESDKLVAIIDWEEACINASLLDFALSVTDCCYNDNVFDMEIFRRMYKAYDSVRPFSAQEIEAMPDAIRYIATVQAAWRFLTHNYLRPNEDKKDYYNELWESGLNTWRMPALS